jgi:hypothetical protein
MTGLVCVISAISFTLEIRPMPGRDGLNGTFLCFKLGDLSL